MLANSFQNVFKLLNAEQTNEFKKKLIMAANKIISPRNIYGKIILRTLLDYLKNNSLQENKFVLSLQKALVELENVDFLPKKNDFLTGIYNLKCVIDKIVGRNTEWLSHEEEKDIRDILSRSINPAIGYSDLEELTSYRLRKLNEIEHSGGIFGKRIVCENCKKKHRMSATMICNGCGNIFCLKCAGHFGSYSTCTCPKNCHFGIELIQEWWKEQAKL